MSLSLKQLIQWGIRKDRAAKDLQDSADARVRPDAISRNRRQDIDGDRSPELALIRNFRSADERLGPRVFLDPLEQELEATEKIPVKPLQVRPRRWPWVRNRRQGRVCGRATTGKMIGQDILKNLPEQRRRRLELTLA